MIEDITSYTIQTYKEFRNQRVEAEKKNFTNVKFAEKPNRI